MWWRFTSLCEVVLYVNEIIEEMTACGQQLTYKHRCASLGRHRTKVLRPLLPRNSLMILKSYLLCKRTINIGCGSKQTSSIQLSSRFFTTAKTIEYMHIWQVSPQLNCGDTRQIWNDSKNLTGILQNQNLFNGIMNQWILSNTNLAHPFELNIYIYIYREREREREKERDLPKC